MIDDLDLLKKIFEDEMIRFMFLVELISSENNYDVKTCQENLEQINFIKYNLDKIDVSEEIKTQVNEYMVKGTEILTNDLKKYESIN